MGQRTPQLDRAMVRSLLGVALHPLAVALGRLGRDDTLRAWRATKDQHGAPADQMETEGELTLMRPNMPF